MAMKEINMLPHMKSLASCLNRIIKDGYTDDFSIQENLLRSMNTNRSYLAQQVKIVNFFRFEGYSDPTDNSILYVVETEDGNKGTLIDAYGVYSDIQVTAFMTAVESMQKKVAS